MNLLHINISAALLGKLTIQSVAFFDSMFVIKKTEGLTANTALCMYSCCGFLPA